MTNYGLEKIEKKSKSKIVYILLDGIDKYTQWRCIPGQFPVHQM